MDVKQMRTRQQNKVEVRRASRDPRPDREMGEGREGVTMSCLTSDMR